MIAKKRERTPNHYKAEYCELLVQYARSGCSIDDFATIVSVTRDTIYHWARIHKDFKKAMRQVVELKERQFRTVRVARSLGHEKL